MGLIGVKTVRKILKRSNGGSAATVLRRYCIEPKKSRYNKKLCRMEGFYDRQEVCVVAKKMEEMIKKQTMGGIL